MGRFKKLIVLAAAVATTAAAASAPASASPPAARFAPAKALAVAAGHPAAPTRAIAGTVQPSLLHSRLVGHASPTGAVRVSLILKPRNTALLAQMAAHSSGRPGLARGLTNALFGPGPLVRRDLTTYMEARGFRPAGNGLLAMAYTGTTAEAEHAFGVSLQRYRLANGTLYRAPSGAVHLPPALASRVITVSGLSTLPLMQPLGLKHAKSHLQPNVLPNCGEPHPAGSFEPAEIAAAGAYDSQTLLDNGNDGTGQDVALVEFSSYNANDLATFQTCHGTSVLNHKMNVDGGTSTTSGGDEVALDQEIVASQAPGLQGIYTYVAPGNDTMAAVLDAISSHRIGTGVRIVSDSWGICEPAELLSDAAATNAELQLLAVNGISFFAASGDSGSSDCQPFGFAGLEVDDPASQPYATGVGGTRLVTSPGRSETVWGGGTVRHGGGGGGISTVFTKPSWQAGQNVIGGFSSKTRCGGKTHYCREVPDISFNSDPNTGYVVYCTTASCSFSPGWTVVGGTSAAAPLMAAFTADANEAAGHNMGFANPFLYHEFPDDTLHMFNDITSGTNNIHGGTKYRAQIGYDVASGMGSIDANNMASALTAYAASAPIVHTSVISASASRNPITPSKRTVISGTLKDHTSHKALGSRAVIIEGFLANSGNYKEFRLHTGRKGGWSLALSTTQLRSNFTWHAVYVGEQAHGPAATAFHVIGVMPTLTNVIGLPSSGGVYHTTAGHVFTISGKSNPNMHAGGGPATVVAVAFRRGTSGTWHLSTSTSRVGKKGGYSVRGFFSTKGTYEVRWQYSGGRNSRWMSTHSALREIAVS